jgi:hypothetical protein
VRASHRAASRLDRDDFLRAEVRSRRNRASVTFGSEADGKRSLQPMQHRTARAQVLTEFQAPLSVIVSWRPDRKGCQRVQAQGGRRHGKPGLIKRSPRAKGRVQGSRQKPLRVCSDQGRGAGGRWRRRGNATPRARCPRQYSLGLCRDDTVHRFN